MIIYYTMSDRFEVAAKDTDILKRSLLVEEMAAEAEEVDVFPVLIGSHVVDFHDVDGGYLEEESCNIVNLIHSVQGVGSPPQNKYAGTIEAHINETYFYMDVLDIREYGEYPDEDYVLSLKVSRHRQGEYAFSQELREDIDKREQEYSYE